MSTHHATHPGDIFLAILAAGGSKRFGDADKLTVPLNGKMLGLHASDMLARFDFLKASVITRSLVHPCAGHWQSAGYTVLANCEADEGMAASIRIAAREAAQSGAAGLMLVLADMPMVSSAHIERMLREFDRSCDQAVIASTEGTHRSPPVLFGKGCYQALMHLRGDIGGREIFEHARLMRAAPEELLDVDTAADLQGLSGD